MATFVLVPGACHGGWWFEPLARRLRSHGHEAHAVTPSGLGDRRHLAGASINLDTHIEDVSRCSRRSGSSRRCSAPTATAAW